MRFRGFLSFLAVVTLSLPALVTPANAGDGSPMDRHVRALLARMTLEEKVGQLFVTYVYGDSATTTAPEDVSRNQAIYGDDVHDGAELVAKYHLGGIIYFNWSNKLTDVQKIGALSNGLQQAAIATGGIPLQISTDQEGGSVNRIGPPVSVSPGNMAIGATFDRSVAYQTAHVSGTELRALGINVDDAPVVDVNTNPRNAADGTRSFGDRTCPVSAFGAEAVKGYQDGGVGAQAKHFPGLGDTTVNTDNGIAVTDQTREQILTIQIPPFRAAIKAGVKSIMAAHIVAPALDPSRAPASLSEPIITRLLRDDLGYDGVVTTDALNAAALADIPPDQVVIRAIEAGDDQLLIPTNLPAAINTLVAAVQDGTISQQRIDQSVYRILRMKLELGLFTDPYTTPERITETVGTPEHTQVMTDAAQRSITLLRNDAGVLPLNAASGQRILVTGWSTRGNTALAAGLTAVGLPTQRFDTGSPGQDVIDTALARTANADIVIVTTGNAWADTAQQSLVRALLGTGKPVIVVAVGTPYDIAYFPTAPTFVAAYGSQPVSMNAVVNVLVGTDPPAGQLPVTIRTRSGDKVLYPYGFGTTYSQRG